MSSIVVSEIHIYPVKSCRGISPNEATLEAIGFQWDRRFMIVDENGVFLTQRTFPTLALVQVSIEGGNLTLAVPGQHKIQLRLGSEKGEEAFVEVWGDRCRALDQGDESAEA